MKPGHKKKFPVNIQEDARDELERKKAKHKREEQEQEKKRIREEQEQEEKRKKENQIDWLIDFKQMGVGGDNSWGAKPHKKYTLPMDTSTYNLEYVLIPFSQKNQLEELARINLDN